MIAALRITAGLVSLLIALSPCVYAQPQDPHAPLFEGDWAVTLFVGFEGPALRIPIEVPDRGKPRKLTQGFAVPGTALRVTLRQYLPDLVWRERARAKEDGGVLVRLALRGPAMDQAVWLDSLNPQRQSISASIGSVRLVALKDGQTLERIREQLVVPDARLGVLRVWPLADAPPLELAIDLAARNTITVPGHTIKILGYMSHYGIHMETGEVYDSAEKAANPALHIEVSDGKTPRQRWLWSRFPQFGNVTGQGGEPGHFDGQEKHTLRAEFVDFEQVHAKGHFTLIVPPSGETFVLSGPEERLRLQALSKKQALAFSDQAYSLTLEEVHVGAELGKTWANKRERLLRPAVVIDCQTGSDAAEQIVLELGKPHHHRTADGTFTLHYGAKRPQAAR